MTFKNFCFLAKKPEMYARVGFFYSKNYNLLLYHLREEADFFEREIGVCKARVAKDIAKNNLKIILERIQFVNKCKNNEF